MLSLVSYEVAWQYNAKFREIQLDYASITQVTSTNGCHWSKIQQTAAELAHVDLQLIKHSREQCTAFFINAFNALLIHAAVFAHGIPQTQFGRDVFYRKLKYNIGGMEFSLDDMQHGILHGNPKTSFLGNRRIAAKDPRSSFIISNSNKNFSASALDISSASNSLANQQIALIDFALATLATHSPSIQILEASDSSSSAEELDKVLYQMCKTYVMRHTMIFDEADKSYLVVPMFLYEHGRQLLQISAKESQKSYHEKLSGFVIEQYYVSGKLNSVQSTRWTQKLIQLMTTMKDLPFSDFTCLLSIDNLLQMKRLKEPVFKKPKPVLKKQSQSQQQQQQQQVQEKDDKEQQQGEEGPVMIMQTPPDKLPKKANCILQ